MRRFSIGFTIFLLVCAAGAATYVAKKYSSASAVISSQNVVEIAGQRIHVDVVNTPAAREKGLGDRASLASDEGMLFVFPKEGVYSFWMKDMRFPIDIIWLSKDGFVVGMWAGASPESFPHSYAPKNVAQYVLEIQSGFATHNKVRIGDLVLLKRQ